MTEKYDTSALAILPFPIPGPNLRHLYRHHTIAQSGTEAEQKRALGRGINDRPWDPATLSNPSYRLEMWHWLEDVVRWFNHEYAWDTSQVIPDCWPEHPHLIHEIAAMADDRYRAALAHNGGPLENWHRVTVPWFLDRMRKSISSYCEEHHQAWPARARYARQVTQESFNQRWLRASEDTQAVGVLSGRPWIKLENGDELNVVTGEVSNKAEEDEIGQEEAERIREALGQPRLPEGPESPGAYSRQLGLA